MSVAIALDALSIPKGVEVNKNKSSISFVKGSKKAILKGHALEITSPLKELGSRVKVYSEDVIEKCHLGAIKAVIPAIEDSVDLQKIINKYFRSK